MKKAIKELIFGKGIQKRRFIGGAMKGMYGHFSLADDTQVWRGIYEVAEQEWLQKAVKPGAVCLDIGGAEGIFALLMAKCAGPTGKVFVFEPSDRGLIISKNFEANSGEQSLASYEHIQEFVIGPETTGLSGVTIDSLVTSGRITQVDVVKMDIDGGERDALEGMKETLQRFRPHISVELHSPELHQHAEGFLKDLGYEMTLVDPPAYELRPIPFNKFYFSKL
jgi:hypothetical protein